MSVQTISRAGVSSPPAIPGHYRTPLGRTLLVIGIGLAVAAATLILGVYDITPDRVLQVLFSGAGSDTDRMIVLDQRLPRMIAAFMVGAALGLSGSIFQSVSRNALGSPDIIGFTVGSATGALMIMLVAGTNISGLGVGAGAIMGGFVTAALVMLLAGVRGGASMGQKMVLIGIAVSAMLAAVNDYLITRASLERAEAAKTWQHGSLNALSWNQVTVPALVLCAVIPVVLLLTAQLRTLELGDDLASGLGLNVRRTTNLLIAGAVALVAIAISIGGPIGFLALVAPQIARRLWNTPGAALWHSALLGGILLMLADFIASHALQPFQFPVGLATGAVGGLYMLWLLRKTR
ncbi:MAG: iron chelate uptake ABC transporter family permease subunit [Rothia sp. (in: high G+C Gram-positive bacteria)]|uniref:FecCD family ABC transporter permease n=1 Tax=Rothia sp. (in: high G+C Gram-positive bacteria) TaxID=1885016 RepID=UPI0026DF6579|nr:iron chelate uptake ABC transporter family permease subunit [Rothia sp. (in: high G+C Gram-positive bacteria)]MDO5750487.1 iron chelate uptake ABC transporter family permease subunit [Rothia sp. (in: high G+C Gram-positive bacteria)]